MKKGQNSFIILFLALTWILFLTGIQNAFSQDKNTVQIRDQANRYFQEQKYDKAAELYKSLYDASGADAYFEYYLRSLIESNDLKGAEKAVRRKLKESDQSKYQVWLGYIYSRGGDNKRAETIYEQVINGIQSERSRIVELGNAFYTLGEMDWAAKVYQEAQKKFPAQQFHYELAQIYFRTRNYPLMLDSYLNLLKEQPKALSTVEGRLITALYYDIDGELKNEMQKSILVRLQTNPGEIVYNQLYVWFLIQQKNYTAALSQALALDRRTGDEAGTLLNLAQLAANGGAYQEAIRAYAYLKNRKGDNPFREEAQLRQTQVAYQHFLTRFPSSSTARDSINQLFQQTFSELGETRQTLFLMEDYARFLAFYQYQPGKAIQLLEKAGKIQGLNPTQKGVVKELLADCNVCAGDYWEAVLLYAQVDESMRETALADEAKFRRARLAYFMGDFNWVKAQMDILKASTSKLTANDALELSLLISNHEAPDSLNSDLRMLARSDLDQFCNRMESALLGLDSLLQQFPYSDLTEDVLYRKATILSRVKRYGDAASVFEDLLTRFPDGKRSDETRFRLGRLYENQLQQPTKAEAIYKDIVLHYPGSVYIEEARKSFRELREK